MADFDFGRGLAAMGESVAKTAGMAALETQRSALEEKKLLLADQLSSVREEKERGFRAGESEKQRGFLSGESALDRATRLETTRMSTAASMANAALSAQVSREGHAIQKAGQEIQREALTPTDVRVALWFEKASPEEKAAFQDTLLAKMPRAQAPEGFRRTEGSDLEAIPGGPKDPAYLSKEAQAKGSEAPPGYRAGPDGSLTAIPGGPADPVVMKSAAEAKRAENEKAIPTTVTKGIQE